MAFDTLQRWHENNHLDTSAYHITPFRRVPIPKYSALPAIALALDKILPSLDPAAQARARVAMLAAKQALDPRAQAYRNAQLDLGVAQANRQLGWLKGGAQLPPGYAIDPINGQPKKLTPDDINRGTYQKTLSHLLDSLRAPQGVPQSATPDQTNDNTAQTDTSQGPLPGLGGQPIPEVTVGDTEDTTGAA